MHKVSLSDEIIAFLPLAAAILLDIVKDEKV